MKKFEEFAAETTSSSGVASILQEVVDTEVIKAMEPKLVGKQLLKEDRKLVGTGGTTRQFRKRNAVSAFTFSEGSSFPQLGASDIQYSTVKATPERFAVQDIIEGLLIQNADFNILEDKKEALVDAMARMADARVWTILLDAVEVPEFNQAIAADGSWNQIDNGGTTYENIYELTAYDAGGNPITTGITVDYIRGYIKSTDTAIASMELVIKDPAATRKIVEATSVGSIGYTDLMIARKEIFKDKFTPDVAVFDPTGVTSLQLDDKFLESEQMAKGVLMNGQLGKAAGLNILMTQEMYEGVAFVANSGQDLGYYVYKEPLKVRVERIPQSPDNMSISMWETSIPCVVNEEAMAIILNGQPNAEKYTP